MKKEEKSTLTDCFFFFFFLKKWSLQHPLTLTPLCFSSFLDVQVLHQWYPSVLCHRTEKKNVQCMSVKALRRMKMTFGFFSYLLCQLFAKLPAEALELLHCLFSLYKLQGLLFHHQLHWLTVRTLNRGEQIRSIARCQTQFLEGQAHDAFRSKRFACLNWLNLSNIRTHLQIWFL